MVCNGEAAVNSSGVGRVPSLVSVSRTEAVAEFPLAVAVRVTVAGLLVSEVVMLSVPEKLFWLLM